jgi:hypothetical protein
MTTAATSSYIPPVIPASLFNSAYTRSITYFNRSQWPNLAYPNNSFISPTAILQTLAVSGPSPIFVASDWKNTDAYQWSMRVERALDSNTNFNAPSTSLNDSNFGKILGAAPGREVQFAMKLIW